MVTTTSDAGAGSLRQALMDASAPTTPTNYTIDFAIPGSGVHTIKPTSSLPVVPKNTTIAGWTQPSYAGSPLIEINGASAGTFRATNLYVEGLILAGGDGLFGVTIDGFAGDQVLVSGANTSIQGDRIGVGPYGEFAAGGDQAGISILNTGNVTIGGSQPGQGNLISGNHWGIYASNDYLLDIEGNAIGLDAAGTKAIGNGFVGIQFVGTHDSIIGGTAAGSANQVVVSQYGIYLTANAGGPYDYNDRILGNELGQTTKGLSLANTNYDLFLDFGTNGNTVAGNVFGPVIGNAGSVVLPVVRDVNPGNSYSGNTGFDASKQQVNVGVTSSYVPAKATGGHVYSFTATFKVTNAGPATATGITLEIDLSSDASFTVVGYDGSTTGSFDPSFVGSGGPHTYLVRFLGLASGQSGSITLNCVNKSGTLAGKLTGSVASDGIDVVTSDKTSSPF